MPLFSESEEKIFGDILHDVVTNTNITRTSAGSKMRALAEAVSKKMGRMYSQFDLNVGQSFLDGAEGKFLNFIGDMMGVARLGETSARINSADKVIRFYVDVGTFGDINGGSSILMTSGTLVSTGVGGTGILYRVTVSTVLDSSADEAFVTAQSVRTGTLSNIGANQLLNHNFTNYSDQANESLKVTNAADIISAQDIEIDSNYRFRIANQVLASERANETAIRLAALAIPGVADVVILPFHKGIGSYDILIKATVPAVPSGLIDTIQVALGDQTAFGIVGTVRAPVEIGISMVGTVTFKKRLSTGEQDAVLTTATENITSYINELDIGEEFIVNEVIERVMATSDNIRSLGTPTKPLDALFIYKPSRLEENKVRSTLISDFQPDIDERPIVENQFAGNTPILFRAG